MPLRCFAAIGCCALAAGAAAAQSPAQQATNPSAASLSAVTRSASEATEFTGLNAALTFSQVHDSASGWYNALTPAVSYTFSPRYSADASASIYPHRLATNTGSTTLTADNGDAGDVLLSAHAMFVPAEFRDIATASLTLPTGERDRGLGTGRTTFNLDNRIERYFGRTALLFDAGGGDSSALVNSVVTADDVAVGPLAQFQLGLACWLPNPVLRRAHDVALQTVAYEQLPLGDQKTYATVAGAPGQTPRVVVNGRRVFEDNGLTTTLYAPLSEHFSLAATYNRSLRLHLDTASVGITWVWRNPARAEASLADRAMGEAERPVQPVPYPR